ncbi:MAG: SIMPL domain-containing protein, partial [Dehalococcoidia bacterium]
TSLRPVRKAAFEAAEERARAVAAASSLTLGDVSAVLELPSATPYGGPVDDPCDPAAALQFKGYGALLPVDSAPEVQVVLDVSVTYQLAASGTGEGSLSKGIVAVGAGSVTAKADEAYIVVLTEAASGPTGPRPIAERDRDDVLERLKALGVAAEDVEFYSPQFGGPNVVSVETDDLANLADLGDDVADAIEEVFGRSYNNGVIFSHSNCEAARDEARKEAIEDARARGASLAGAASLKLSGRVDSVAEAPIQSPYGPAPIDPCEEDLSAVALGGYGTADIKPFTAEPEFTVRSVLSVSFEVE